MIVTTATPLLRERAAQAALPPAVAGQENVLLIVLDTHRAASMSVVGGTPGTTPQLSRWANEGVVFDQAYSTTSWTLPSHATMFTGRYNFELGTDEFTPLGSKHETLAEFFANHGYRTGGFVANLFYTVGFFGLNRGFHRYRDHPASVETALANAWWTRFLGGMLLRRLGLPPEFPHRKAAPVVNSQFLDWVGGSDERPFFAFLNYMDAHAPYRTADESGREPASGAKRWYPRGDVSRMYSATELANLKAGYETSIHYVDHYVGSLLEELNAGGFLHNTIVIITSDHGEAFGEHGFLGHKHTLYPEEVHVPLLVLLPPALRDRVAGLDSLGASVAGTTRVQSPVSLRDIPASLVDLLQLESDFPGTSIFRQTRSDTLLAEIDDQLWSITAGTMRYVYSESGREELYDAAEDPQYMVNLGERPEYLETLETMRRALENRAPVRDRIRD